MTHGALLPPRHVFTCSPFIALGCDMCDCRSGQGNCLPDSLSNITAGGAGGGGGRMGRLVRLVPFFRMAQKGNMTRFYSPLLVSHSSPRLSMTLQMFQVMNCPRCPRGSCLSQFSAHPLAGPRWPDHLLAIHQNTKGQTRGHGLGLFPGPAPKRFAPHCRATASTVSWCTRCAGE